MDDYAPVMTQDDEEERRRQADEYPPIPYIHPRYANIPEVDPRTAALGTTAVPPAGPVTKRETMPMVGAEVPAVARPRPQWSEYAPPESHGWGKFGHTMAAFSPITNKLFNELPQKRAEEAYKKATEEYAAPITEEHTKAQTALEQAQTGEAQARTEALRNPPEKVGNTPEELTLHYLLTGDNGKPVTNPETGKPYNTVEAYRAMKKAGQEAKPEKPDTPEQQYLDDFMKRNPGSTLADAVRAYAKDSQRPERTGAGEARETARSDRSYQFHSQRIDKLAAPVEQRLERIARLQDTLDAGTPQADALVAPELLSVMAGGQASGLRMNEAEISRIIGGRTNWETLKAKLGAWQLDPNKGFSLTPDQRQQVKQLFAAVKERAEAKAKLLDDARGELANSDDPAEHRQIYVRTAKALQEADTKAGGPENKGEFKVPDGAPAAPKEDGHKLKVNGNVVAISQGGKWVAPQ